MALSRRQQGNLLPLTHLRGQGRQRADLTRHQPVLGALLALLSLTWHPWGWSLQTLSTAGEAEAQKATPAYPEPGSGPSSTEAPPFVVSQTSLSPQNCPCLPGWVVDMGDAPQHSLSCTALLLGGYPA